MREPWAQRRKRLENLLEGQRLERVERIGLVPVDHGRARTLGDVGGGMGGEGIVLKDRDSIYRPGERSPAWLKLKLTLETVVTGGSAKPIPWATGAEAVMLELRYSHYPRDGSLVEIRQAVRIPRHEPFEVRIGSRAELVCCGAVYATTSSERPAASSHLRSREQRSGTMGQNARFG
jgi:hypothetical protein